MDSVCGLMRWGFAGYEETGDSQTAIPEHVDHDIQLLTEAN